MVFFEAPHRTEAALAAMAEALGDDRPAAVCRELTKTHEEVRRGPLAELVAWAADGVRGEVTIVVEGSSGAPARRHRPRHPARGRGRPRGGRLHPQGGDRRGRQAGRPAQAGGVRRCPPLTAEPAADPQPRGHRGDVGRPARPRATAGARAAAAPRRRQPLPPRHRRRRLARHGGRHRGRGGRRRAAHRADRLRPARRPLGGGRGGRARRARRRRRAAPQRGAPARRGRPTSTRRWPRSSGSPGATTRCGPSARPGSTTSAPARTAGPRRRRASGATSTWPSGSTRRSSSTTATPTTTCCASSTRRVRPSAG